MQFAAGRTRAAAQTLKDAIRWMIGFGYRVRSLNGRRQISPAVRAKLLQMGVSIRDDMATLKTSL